MGKYRISDLNLLVDAECKTFDENAKQFENDFDCTPNETLYVSKDRVLQLMEENDGIDAETIKTHYLACIYSRMLFDFNGVPINSIAIDNGDSCVLFSAPFDKVDLLELLPKDKIFSVGYPGIRLIDDKFYVYGTPFGKFGEYAKDKKLPLSSIVFIDEKRCDSLKKLEANDFVPLFTRAVMLNVLHERTKHTLFMLEKMIKCTNIYGVKKLDDVNFILDRV